MLNKGKRRKQITMANMTIMFAWLLIAFLPFCAHTAPLRYSKPRVQLNPSTPYGNSSSLQLHSFQRATTSSMLRGGIVIEEVLQNPVNGVASFDTDRNGQAEAGDGFVELYNTASTPINLGFLELWEQSYGLWFAFPDDAILPARRHAVVVLNIQTRGRLPQTEFEGLAFNAALDEDSAKVLLGGSQNIILLDPLATSIPSYVQLTLNGASAIDPGSTIVEFPAGATRIGEVELWPATEGGTSLTRFTPGDTSIVSHKSISWRAASPGASADEVFTTTSFTSSSTSSSGSSSSTSASSASISSTTSQTTLSGSYSMMKVFDT